MKFLRRMVGHPASILALSLGLTACAVAQAPSQPQAQTQGQSTQGQPDVLIGTETTPAIVRITKSPEETTQENEDRQRDMEMQQATIRLGKVMAGLTVALIYVGWKQRQTYEATLAANKVTARAYVKISHEWFAGSPAEFITSEPVQQLRAHITVKNEGQTPADVLGGAIWAHVGAQQERPTRMPTPGQDVFRVEPVFLTGGGGDFVRAVASAPLQRPYRGQGDQLWLLGYVDYRDRFKDFHRTAYCRHLEDGDLVFNQTTTGLNYDEPLSAEQIRVYSDNGR